MPSSLTMTEAEAAWVAGILEGEGSFVVQYHKGRSKGQIGHRGHYTACVRVSMTDRDVVIRVATLCGRPELVRAERLRPGKNKQPWRLQLTRKADVAAVCLAIYPWLGERRRAQVDKLLDLLASKGEPLPGRVAA